MWLNGTNGPYSNPLPLILRWCLEDIKEPFISSNMNNRFPNKLKHWVFYNWKINPPQWFISILWNDLPTDPIKVTKYSKDFKNIFLSKLYGVSKCSKLKDFPDRVGMTFFQERKMVSTSTRGFLCFHTHLHISNPTGTNIDGGTIHNLIMDKCSRNLPKLLKTEQDGNKGVVVKDWNREHHLHYNFKDLFTYKDHQDGDICLDLLTSDLLPFRHQWLLTKNQQPSIYTLENNT